MTDISISEDLHYILDYLYRLSSYGEEEAEGQYAVYTLGGGFFRNNPQVSQTLLTALHSYPDGVALSAEEIKNIESLKQGSDYLQALAEQTAFGLPYRLFNPQSPYAQTGAHALRSMLYDLTGFHILQDPLSTDVTATLEKTDNTKESVVGGMFDLSYRDHTTAILGGFVGSLQLDHFFGFLAEHHPASDVLLSNTAIARAIRLAQTPTGKAVLSELFARLTGSVELSYYLWLAEQLPGAEVTTLLDQAALVKIDRGQNDLEYYRQVQQNQGYAFLGTEAKDVLLGPVNYFLAVPETERKEFSQRLSEKYPELTGTPLFLIDWCTLHFFRDRLKDAALQKYFHAVCGEFPVEAPEAQSMLVDLFLSYLPLGDYGDPALEMLSLLAKVPVPEGREKLQSGSVFLKAMATTPAILDFVKELDKRGLWDFWCANNLLSQIQNLAALGPWNEAIKDNTFYDRIEAAIKNGYFYNAVDASLKLLLWPPEIDMGSFRQNIFQIGIQGMYPESPIDESAISLANHPGAAQTIADPKFKEWVKEVQSAIQSIGMKSTDLHFLITIYQKGPVTAAKLLNKDFIADWRALDYTCGTRLDFDSALVLLEYPAPKSWRENFAQFAFENGVQEHNITGLEMYKMFWLTQNDPKLRVEYSKIISDNHYGLDTLQSVAIAARTDSNARYSETLDWEALPPLLRLRALMIVESLQNDKELRAQIGENLAADWADLNTEYGGNLSWNRDNKNAPLQVALHPSLSLSNYAYRMADPSSAALAFAGFHQHAVPGLNETAAGPSSSQDDMYRVFGGGADLEGAHTQRATEIVITPVEQNQNGITHFNVDLYGYNPAKPAVPFVLDLGVYEVLK